MKSWSKKFIEFNSFLFLDVSPNETNNIKLGQICLLELNKLLKGKSLNEFHLIFITEGILLQHTLNFKIPSFVKIALLSVFNFINIAQL